MEGDMLLGAVLIADEKLYDKKNKESSSAVFIYSYDKFYEENPAELKLLIRNLHNYTRMPKKEISEIFEKKRIVDILNEEYTLKTTMELPMEFTDGRKVYITNSIVYREEIRDKMLGSTFYPIIVKQGVPAVVILNYKFYSPKPKDLPEKEKEDKKVKKNKNKGSWLIYITIGLAFILFCGQFAINNPGEFTLILIKNAIKALILVSLIQLVTKFIKKK